MACQPYLPAAGRALPEKSGTTLSLSEGWCRGWELVTGSAHFVRSPSTPPPSLRSVRPSTPAKYVLDSTRHLKVYISLIWCRGWELNPHELAPRGF